LRISFRICAVTEKDHALTSTPSANGSQDVKEVANPYNALQPFTTNALCAAEL
jgi:hypothetical protein